MDEVADGLFVGTATDATDEALLRTHDIDIVVSLTHASPATGPVTRIDVPMMDGPKNSYDTFADAVRTVVSQRDSGQRVLVHCAAGASRSPAVAAAVLTHTTGRSLGEAFTEIRDRRPETDPHDALIRQAAAVVDALDE